MTKRECPNCCSQKALKLLELEGQDYDGSSLPLKRDLVECRECGFLFTDACYTEELLRNYYSNYYQGLSGKSQPYTCSHLLDRDKSITDLILSYFPSGIVPRLTICDAGCGRGELLEEFYKYRVEALFGVEPGLFPKEDIDTRNFITINADLYDFILPCKADVIISTHVFEHLLDINRAMKNIANNLKDNGYVYIEVPNAEITGDQSVIISNYIPEHINMFTAETLSNLLMKNGFVPVNIITESIPSCCSNILGVFAKKSADVCSFMDEKPFKTNLIKEQFKNIHYNINDSLKRFVKTNSIVYVWGVSNVVFQLLTYSSLKNCNVVFVDKSPEKQKKTIRGELIYSPEIIRLASENSVVVVGSYLRRESIISELKDMGYRGTLIEKLF